jgi:hypothetical protein
LVRQNVLQIEDLLRLAAGKGPVRVALTRLLTGRDVREIGDVFEALVKALQLFDQVVLHTFVWERDEVPRLVRQGGSHGDVLHTYAGFVDRATPPVEIFILNVVGRPGPQQYVHFVACVPHQLKAGDFDVQRELGRRQTEHSALRAVLVPALDGGGGNDGYGGDDDMQMADDEDQFQANQDDIQ